MCGIVGYVGGQAAMPILMSGLAQLEYRGYDSAGIALHRGGSIDVIKRCGRLAQLQSALPKRSAAKSGIGHTRWATHGEPSDLNAHPHSDPSGKVVIVHNGIVENARELRQFLQEAGVECVTETDTEVLAALVQFEYERVSTGDLMAGVSAALRRISGTYGIAVLHLDHPNEIVAARNGSPVVLGVGDREMFVASDVAALVAHTRQVVYLDDGEIASVTPRGYEVQNHHAQSTHKSAETIDIGAMRYELGEHDSYTLKEIEEQPESVERVLRGRLDTRFHTAHLGGLNLDAKALLAVRRVKVLGCGSAHIAGAIGAAMIERLARIPADAESAAEFRYRNPVIEHDTLYLAVSQSGETYDTLSAVQEIQRKGGTVLGVINAVGSTIARQCEGGVYLHAGPEVAVVSTKTFTSTLTVFVLLALFLGRMRDTSPSDGKLLVETLQALPEQIRQTLQLQPQIEDLANQLKDCRNAYFIGRGMGYGLACEGALKLKEVSYVHAEAYPASELKHGPLALVDEFTPTFAILPDDELYDKNLSTLAEIKTRNGPLVVFGQRESIELDVDTYIRVPDCHPLVMPILMTLPLQLMAYSFAQVRGCDVDKPRNLAKSVTVE